MSKMNFIFQVPNLPNPWPNLSRSHILLSEWAAILAVLLLDLWRHHFQASYPSPHRGPRVSAAKSPLHRHCGRAGFPVRLDTTRHRLALSTLFLSTRSFFIDRPSKATPRGWEVARIQLHSIRRTRLLKKSSICVDSKSLVGVGICRAV